MNNFFDTEHKKGNPDKLSGLLTVYARINDSQEHAKGPAGRLGDMAPNGLLAAQGNYRDQNSLKDFLKQEFGSSFDDEDGVKKFVEGLGGIEGALDPDKFKDKLKELESMEDFIPTPAKMAVFSSEDEILRETGDVYYIGSFENSANANLAVNALTIMYQAKYRESQILSVRSEIDSMISQLESGGTYKTVSISDAEVHDVTGVLLKKLIPELIHSYGNSELRRDVMEDIRLFLRWYEYPDDLDRIFALTDSTALTGRDNTILELIVRKIAALGREDFDEAARMVKKIQEYEEQENE
ncbi:MAG: hypothetical protein ACQEQ4_06190 [Fibrobacterota bacterium]